MIDTVEELNIKDFAINEPKKNLGSPFNPARDIPAEAWGQMIDSFDQELSAISQAGPTTMRPNAILESASEILTLSKNSKKFDRAPKILSGDWDIIDNEFRDHKVDGNWPEYLSALHAIHIIDPERAKDAKYHISSVTMDSILDELKQYGTDKYFHYLSIIKIVDPSRQIETPPERWISLKEKVNKFGKEKSADWHERRGESLSVMELINNAKFVDPEKVRKIFPHDQIPWDELKNILQQTLNANTGLKMLYYSIYAYQLLLLSADEINVGENGLELVMPKPEADLKGNSDLPKMRNF